MATNDKKKIKSIGLKYILVGDVQASGMPAEMSSLGKTLKGTANFTTEQDSVQDFFSEENPTAPEESVTTEVGLKNLSFNLMEWDNDTLVKVFGGVVVKESVTLFGKTIEVLKYKAPKDSVTIEMALRAITPYRVALDIPRAKITARFIWNFTRTEIAQIEVQARALSPSGEDDGPYEIFAIPDDADIQL